MIISPEAKVCAIQPSWANAASAPAILLLVAKHDEVTFKGVEPV